MRYLSALLGFLLVWLAFTAPAAAAAFASGVRLHIAPNERVEGDLYAAGAEVVVDGHVEGDLIVAGGIVRLNGSVEGSVIAAGGRIETSGRVGRSMRLLAADARVASPVGGDLLVTAGDLSTASATHVKGASYLRAGEMRLMGHLGRELLASASALELGGSVVGDARLSAPRLFVGPDARVAGQLAVETAVPDPIARGAVVGSLTRQIPRDTRTWLDALRGWALSYVTALLAGLALLALAPGAADQGARLARHGIAKRLLLGLGVLLGAPVAAILTMLTVIGLPIGLIGLAAYVVMVYVAPLLVAWTVGHTLAPRLRLAPTPAGRALAFGLGLLVVTVLRSTPVLGPYLTFTLVLWGLGALSLLFYQLRRPLIEAAPEAPAEA